MTAMTGTGSIPAPTHPENDFMAYETECREVLKPVMAALLDMAVSLGWNRRTVASTLMFLAAQQISAASSKAASECSDVADG